MDATERFLQAVKNGDDIVIEQQLMADPSLAASRDPQGLSALMLSLYYRQRIITSLLLDQGLVLDLYEAAGVGDTWRMQHLIGVDPRLAWDRSVDGFTALHIAAAYGQVGAVGVLLSAGADANAVSDNLLRVQPLHSAVGGRHLEVAKLLLDARADVSAKQADGLTPIMLAQGLRDAELVALLKQYGAKDDPGMGLMRG
jgi:ankyrin repeat protein